MLQGSCKEEQPNPHSTVNLHHWKSQVKENLERVGFLSFLQITNHPQLPNSLLMGAYKSEFVDNIEISNKIAEICEGCLTDCHRDFLLSMLSELDTNLKQHAYLGLNRENRPDWWLYAHFDTTQKTLRVGFYDVGFSIPRTLEMQEQSPGATRSWVDFLRNSQANKLVISPKYGKDGHDLFSALETRASRMTEQGRGNGLFILYKSVDDIPGTTLKVLSRSGFVEKASQGKPQKRSLPGALKGTFISLSFSL